jgi:hypothetical protein
VSARALALVAVLLLPATAADAQSVLFPPETPACYVGAEVAPAAAAAPARKSAAAPAVTAVRLQRGYPQLAFEETLASPKDGERKINLRVIVTFTDAGRGAPKRFADGLFSVLSCSADACDAGNFKVERQSDGAVLLRMTGGLNVGGGDDVTRRLADGKVYRLEAKGMEACR